MTDAKTRRFRNLLETKKSQLEALCASSAEARAPVNLDQQSVGRVSRVDAMQQQAMAQAQDRQRRTDLIRTEQALGRIADGSYGNCLDCDEPIAIRRLEVDPAASHCVRCADRN